MATLAQKISRIMADFFGGNVPLSNRNYIVDGNFEQWLYPSGQITAVGGNVQNCIMYYNGAGAGGVANVSRIGTETVVLIPGMTAPAMFGMQHNQTTASTGAPAPLIGQRIENAYSLNGRSATFSCWLWSNTAGGITIPSVTVGVDLGNGGTPSANPATVTTAVNWMLTTAPKRFSLRVDFPNISGLTVGTNNNHFTAVNVNLPTGITFNVLTAQWQLESCSAQAPAAGMPTAFEYRGVGPEAARVNRYYQAQPPLERLWGSVTTSGGMVFTYRPYVPMRGTPSISCSGGGTGTLVESPPWSQGINATYAYQNAHASPGTMDLYFTYTAPSPVPVVGTAATWINQGFVFDARL
jgi:hypothetical protein